MRTRPPRSLTLALGPLTLLLLGAGPAEPEAPSQSTDGECVEVTLYFWLLGGPDEYVIGPDHCVVGTPWSGSNSVGGEVPVSQIDSGVGFRVQIPEPEDP